jgi:hypothetical protein
LKSRGSTVLSLYFSHAQVLARIEIYCLETRKCLRATPRLAPSSTCLSIWRVMAPESRESRELESFFLQTILKYDLGACIACTTCLAWRGGVVNVRTWGAQLRSRRIGMLAFAVAGQASLPRAQGDFIRGRQPQAVRKKPVTPAACMSLPGGHHASRVASRKPLDEIATRESD